MTKWYRRLPALLGGLGVAALITPAVIYRVQLGSWRFASEPGPWGLLGDYYGGIAGTILSFVTLVALAINLYQQAKQLELAHAEIDRQQAALERQSFESMFFQLLNQFREVASGVRFGKDPGQGDAVGRAAFALIFDVLRNRYFQLPLPPNTRPDQVVVAESYRDVYKLTEPELGPYFRCLYHVFRFIEEGPLNEKQKAVYASIARAQLSKYEVLVLFYTGTWGEGRKFRTLIGRFGILKHVASAELLVPQHMDVRDWYALAAFQDAKQRAAGA